LHADYINTVNNLAALTDPYRDKIDNLNGRRYALQEMINRRLRQAMEAEGLAIREMM